MMMWILTFIRIEIPEELGNVSSYYEAGQRPVLHVFTSKLTAMAILSLEKTWN
jgi:hypothetical protein